MTLGVKLVWDVRDRKRARERAEPQTDPTPLPSAAQLGVAAPQRVVLLPGRNVFVNREQEMAELRARVRAGRDGVVTIEGNRWIGKSATAAELAHALVVASPEDGFDPTARSFIWMDARDKCPSIAEICGHLSRVTDDRALATVAGAHKRDRLRIHLASTRTVLVLDNLRLGDDATSAALIEFLEELPEGPLVIASVNRPGNLVAPRVPLGDLDVANVAKLVEDRVRTFHLDGLERVDESLAARLHGLVGGNPGVIDWFLRGYRLSADSLEERIEAIEQGTELAELFGATWESLDERPRSVLAACAHLRGEATARQLAVACGGPLEEVRSAIELLHREGLLTAIRGADQPTVYSCARAFQVFVSSQTPSAERAAYTDRLADDYISHFAAHPEDAQWAVSEIGALRVVREELFEACDDDRMQALFRATLDILFTLGQFDELLASSFLAIQSADRVDNFASAALAAAINACTHAIRGERALALEAYAHGSIAAESSGEPAPIGRMQRCRGFLHHRFGEPEQALATTAETEELARQAGDTVNVVDTLDLRTAANWHLGRLDGCERAAQASLAASTEVRWERARAYPLRYLAEIAAQRRRPEEARALLDEAEAVATRFGDRRQLARIRMSRARQLLLAGHPESAADAVRHAVEEATRLGLPPERQEALALEQAVRRAQRSALWRRYYALRRPLRFTGAPVGGD
ncbi:MAG TPA: hypothetical protein VGW10_13140 [Solirubrobacteraceae bacterium]|nr:hypothetical protein [Solirubrobacteraceae bacterium]